MTDPPFSGPAGTSVRVVVFGYHDVGVACLEALLEQRANVLLVVTHVDDPAEQIWFGSVARAATLHGIPVRTPEDPNTPALVDEVRRLRPDLMFSFYYRRLLGRALLDVPRLGAINVHGSLLPKYRGRAPINWALVQGETLTGVTLHHMDEWADHGDIIAQRPVSVAVEDTALTVSRKLTVSARELLAETYTLIASDRAPRTPQDHAAATRFGRRGPADGLIDWQASAWRIYNLVRAVTHPFPGAFTYWGNRRVFVWSARPPRRRLSPGPAGRILGVGNGRSLEVATGDGVLDVVCVQLDGEAEMDGAEFVAAVGSGGANGVTPRVFGDAARRGA
jgi:methionyl-tRNA formyltransferase